MSVHRADESRLDAADDVREARAAPKAPASRSRNSSAPAPGAPMAAPRSSEEAEERYVVARDAWIVAMRNAKSGRSADLASLALTQEAYELATAEVERWRSGVMVAFEIDAAPAHQVVETAVDQEIAWRHVHDQRSPGRLGRLLRRLTGGQ